MRPCYLGDTVGIRRKGNISDSMERYSGIRALRATECCDGALLVLEGPEGGTEQDKKIVEYYFYQPLYFFGFLIGGSKCHYLGIHF